MKEYRVSGHIGSVSVDIGKKVGLYHTMKGRGQDVFVGHGLGGTSLINANVFLRAEHRTLAVREWPKEIRDNPASLDECESSRKPAIGLLNLPFTSENQFCFVSSKLILDRLFSGRVSTPTNALAELLSNSP